MVGHGRDGEVPLPFQSRGGDSTAVHDKLEETQDENDEYFTVAILSVRALAVPAVLSLVHARFPSSR